MVQRGNARVWLCALAVVIGAGASTNRIWGRGATATPGTVADASGAAIPDANIEVKNVGTGTQVVSADAQGRFPVQDLIVVEYEIQASKSGFLQ